MIRSIDQKYIIPDYMLICEMSNGQMVQNGTFSQKNQFIFKTIPF